MAKPVCGVHSKSASHTKGIKYKKPSFAEICGMTLKESKGRRLRRLLGGYGCHFWRKSAKNDTREGFETQCRSSV